MLNVLMVICIVVVTARRYAASLQLLLENAQKKFFFRVNNIANKYVWNKEIIIYSHLILMWCTKRYNHFSQSF